MLYLLNFVREGASGHFLAQSYWVCEEELAAGISTFFLLCKLTTTTESGVAGGIIKDKIFSKNTLFIADFSKQLGANKLTVETNNSTHD